MTQTFRRIVTGHNEKGRSIVMIDGPEGASFGSPRAGLYDFWSEGSGPADNNRPGDTVEGPVTLEPPTHGSKFRFFSISPRDPAISSDELDAMASQAFDTMQASHCRKDTSRDPSMHITRTIDYIIVLDGEVTLLLDEEEVDLKPFDVVVQRGTNHAWIAKGNKPVLMAAILMDALPLKN